MALYEYQATDSSGALVRGQLTAADDRAAQRELEARGLTVVDLLWCPAADHQGRLGDEAVSTLTDSIAAAATNRVPLDVTLAALAEEKGDPHLADVAQRLAEVLRKGATVDQAIASL